MIEEKIKALVESAKEEKHEEVVKCYLTLDKSDRLDHLAMLAYADSLYELGKDVESLEAYLEFALQHPKGKAVDFALYGASMSLNNLGLQDEALYLLQLIDPEHEGLNKEMEHCRTIINKKIEAKLKFEKISEIELLLNN